MKSARIIAPAFLSTLAFSSFSLLGGCAGTANTYPSLAPRPIERVSIEEPVVAQDQAPPPVADPARDAGVAAQLAAAEAAQAQFSNELVAARRAVGAAVGKPLESEPWVAAQQALSRLDQRRGAVTSALANLDEMMVASGGAASPVLGDAWTRVSDIDADQRSTFNELAAKLAQP